jgi:hypothetical protein
MLFFLCNHKLLFNVTILSSYFFCILQPELFFKVVIRNPKSAWNLTVNLLRG